MASSLSVDASKLLSTGRLSGSVLIIFASHINCLTEKALFSRSAGVILSIDVTNDKPSSSSVRVCNVFAVIPTDQQIWQKFQFVFISYLLCLGSQGNQSIAI